MPASKFSNHKFHREPAWQSFRRIPGTAIPAEWRGWLLDKGSLTQRLQDLSGNRVRVRILRQKPEFPRLSEIRALGLRGRQLALVREVILYGGDEPWVYARSILPLGTLTGRLRKLRRLDNRPLGGLLFSDPKMRRCAMEIACLTSANAELPPELGAVDTPLWGRRSVFLLDDKPLLVSEIFLPTFSPYNKIPPQGFRSP